SLVRAFSEKLNLSLSQHLRKSSRSHFIGGSVQEQNSIKTPSAFYLKDKNKLLLILLYNFIVKMAQAASPLDQEQFSCTICLELLKEPVTIPCGHSYCRGCIENSWDQEANAGEYSCPQCRETFNPKPTLRKNTILADVVEKLKKTALQVTLSAHCNTVPADVMCDACIDVECKAVESCLVCLASYCETHLQPHYESPAFKKHKLVKATGNLQEKICSHHHKLLDVYCRNDQQFICDVCTIEQHKDHATVSLTVARNEKQKLVEATQGELKRTVQEREKELQDLKEAVLSIKRSAQAALEDSERIFTELIRSIEKRCSEVKQLIRDQEKAEVKLADKLLEQLEEEIAELKSRDAELEQLSYAEDHIHFLQSAKALCVAFALADQPSVTVSPHISFEAVSKGVAELKERLEDVCEREMSKISAAGRAVGICESYTETEKFPEPRATAAEEKICPHCLGPFKNKLKLQCTHAFCSECLQISVQRLGRLCPVCLTPLTVLGNQPEGEMSVKRLKDINGRDCFCITYNIPSGIQTEAHPNPGKPFAGMQTEAWLPYSDGYSGKTGEKMLKLLQKAFELKLIFAVEATDGAADRVVLNGIPHARNL
ncbi:hypothetical protein GJAV_G00069270, partial [Gymnothorax javanicus]